MNPQLLAPCGMDCSVCSGYLAFLNEIPRQRGRISHCEGCRPRKKSCAFLKGHCERLQNEEVEFCFECPEYPCARLQRLDERYRRDYGMSLLTNLEEIRSLGVSGFQRQQKKKFGCPTCGGKISVHNQKCFHCDRVSSWRRS